LTGAGAVATLLRVEGTRDGLDPLIVERLGDEVLVYDTETHEAHRLSGAAAAEFSAASEVSRREALRRLALAGAAAAGTAGLVRSIAAPTPAQAQSNCTVTCLPGDVCCGATCCSAGAFCCAPGSQSPCCFVSATFCCPAGSANGCGTANGGTCGIGVECCSGVCTGGQCVAPASDRDVKYGLAPVVPGSVVSLLG
jgi:hypothetical protein